MEDFRLHWTGPDGACSESAPTAKVAVRRYVELLGSGLAEVKVYDKAGRELSLDDLFRRRRLEWFA
jgi:hypothetical protein